MSSSVRSSRMAAYDGFVERWPSLQDWFDAPLADRLFDRPDVVRGQHPHGGASVIMSYLTYLSLVHGVALDYEVLLARTFTSPFTTATYPNGLGIDLEAFDRHMQRLVQLGYARSNVRQQLSWPLGRVLLHRGDPDLTAVTVQDLDELRGAVAGFLPRLEQEGLRDFYARPGRRLPGTEPTRAYFATATARIQAAHTCPTPPSSSSTNASASWLAWRPSLSEPGKSRPTWLKIPPPSSSSRAATSLSRSNPPQVEPGKS